MTVETINPVIAVMNQWVQVGKCDKVFLFHIVYQLQISNKF